MGGHGRGRPGGEVLGDAITWLDSRGAEQARRAAGGGPRVAGYGAAKLWSWIRLTGGAPSLSGRDPLGHILWLADQRPEVYAATETSRAGRLAQHAPDRAALASHDTATIHWVTDTRDRARIDYDERLLRAAGLDR